MLPSQVVNNATTFDLVATDIYQTYMDIKENPQNKAKYFDTTQLQDLLAKNKNGKRKNQTKN